MPVEVPDLRLDFGNLPLIEAAVRASFHGPVAISYAVVKSVESRLKSDFPVLTEPQQIETAPGYGLSPAEIGLGILPGAVYAGHAAGLTVSLHPQVVVARWVKQPSPYEVAYPRFASLRNALWNAIEALREHVGDAFPGVAVVNMSYVNFLPASDPASVVATYFSKQAQLALMERARQVRKLEAAWSERDHVDIRFALEQVTAKLADTVTDGYRLTTAAGVRLSESLDAKALLEKIHGRLQTFFLELVSEQAQTEWQLTKVPNA